MKVKPVGNLPRSEDGNLSQPAIQLPFLSCYHVITQIQVETQANTKETYTLALTDLMDTE